uniref:Protein HEXIM-like n=1 Tax=Petromyzon marinus TaxID=7757 RepID=A0AAJ7TDA3_PETMA|nr:protein HEXIM-like [Petromyzon marinus]
MAAVVSGAVPGTTDGPEEGSARRCGSGRAGAASPVGAAARDERGVGDVAAPTPRSHVQTQQQQPQQQPPTASRRRHRRRPSKKKQRRWRPYLTLSWEEKKAMEERESERAARMRAEMAAKGLAVAPYNTTQFLMDEHDREEPDLEPAGSDGGGGDNDGDEDSDEGDDGGEGDDELPSRLQGGRDGFLQRDFSETYERYHVESLSAMSKGELVREYLELEKCLSRLEEENLRLRECLGERGCWRGPAVALEAKPASRHQAPLAAAAAPSSLRSPPAAEIAPVAVTQQQQQRDEQSTEGPPCAASSGGGVEDPSRGEGGSLAKSHHTHAGGAGDALGKQLVVDLQAEVERLQRENGRLAHQNELLQQQQPPPEANVME